MDSSRRRFISRSGLGTAVVMLPWRKLSALDQGSNSQIIYPRRSTTSIVKSGETFEVWFNSVKGQKIESIELKSPFLTVPVKHTGQQGEWVCDEISGNTFNTKIKVPVPKGVPADRYTLHIKTPVEEVVSGGAVKVIREFRDEYYVLQFSDVHRWQGGYDGMLTMRKVSEILKIAHIIDPEIIFETGDNMYNVVNHPEREHSYYHGFPELGILGLHDVSAATFISPGNHDSPNNNFMRDKDVQETARFFNRYYGLGVHNFTYGNGRFCMFNDAWGADAVDLAGQAREAAVWLDQVGPGNFVLGVAHIFGGEFARFDRQVKVDIGLVGHNHHKAPENPHPANETPKLYVANSVREPAHFEFNLFRVNNKTGECVAVSGAQGRCPVLQDSSAEVIADPSQWISNLEQSFALNNDGSEPSNTATIINRYDFPIPGTLVRFVIPKGETYTISEGAIEQAFDGDAVRVVDVRVTLPSGSTTTIKIQPV